MIEKKDGKINVLIDRADFIGAVKLVAESNLELAKALRNQVKIVLKDLTINAAETGIYVGSMDLSQEEMEEGQD